MSERETLLNWLDRAAARARYGSWLRDCGRAGLRAAGFGRTAPSVASDDPGARGVRGTGAVLRVHPSGRRRPLHPAAVAAADAGASRQGGRHTGGVARRVAQRTVVHAARRSGPAGGTARCARIAHGGHARRTPPVSAGRPTRAGCRVVARASRRCGGLVPSRRRPACRRAGLHPIGLSRSRAGERTAGARDPARRGAGGTPVNRVRPHTSSLVADPGAGIGPDRRRG